MKPKAKALLILFALTIALVPFAIDTNAGGQTRPPRKRVRVVEPNERYVVLNKRGEKTREYGPGEEMPDDGSCVEIKCPKSVKDAGRGKTIRCWRCGTN